MVPGDEPSNEKLADIQRRIEEQVRRFNERHKDAAPQDLGTDDVPAQEAKPEQPPEGLFIPKEEIDKMHVMIIVTLSKSGEFGMSAVTEKMHMPNVETTLRHAADMIRDQRTERMVSAALMQLAAARQAVPPPGIIKFPPDGAV